MTQKAQITIFIILGIFILLAAMLIIYFVYSQTRIEQKIFPKEALNNVQNLATSCLEQKAMGAINLLAKQGGVIYKNQEGLTDESSVNFVIDGTEKIAKLVDLPAFTFSDPNIVVSTELPDYPWTTFPYINYGKINQQKKYAVNVLFGVNKIQPLENEPNSWKSQIETKTQKELLNCINTPQLQTQGITIATIAPVVTATITDKDFLVSSSAIQLLAQDGTTASTSVIKAKIPINLKKLYELVNRIISNEVFNISTQPLSTAEFTANQFKKKESNTIVSIIYGKTTFQFAMPNRKPALEYIESLNEIFCEGSQIDFNQLNKKLTIIPPSTLPTGITACPQKTVEFKALDPENDQLTFNVKVLTPLNTPLPFTVTGVDCVKLRASVTDSQYEDYQDFDIKLKAGITC